MHAWNLENCLCLSENGFVVIGFLLSIERAKSVIKFMFSYAHKRMDHTRVPTLFMKIFGVMRFSVNKL